MIGAEAKIAEAYHAFKSGDLAEAERLLSGIHHASALTLLAKVAQQRALSQQRKLNDPAVKW